MPQQSLDSAVIPSNLRVSDIIFDDLSFNFTKEFPDNDSRDQIDQKILTSNFPNGSLGSILKQILTRGDCDEIISFFPKDIWLLIQTLDLRTGAISSRSGFPIGIIDSSIDDSTNLSSSASSSSAKALFYAALLNATSDNKEVFSFIKSSFEKCLPIENNLNLASLNVWGIPSFLGGRAPKRFTEIGNILASQQYDIICLQEMWDKRTKEIIIRSGYPFVVDDGRYPGLKNSSGLVTLSKFPIIEQTFTAFENASTIEKFVKKGILRTRILSPLGEVEILNVHMCSDTESSLEKATLIRLKQIQQLKSLVQKYSIQRPVIVMGDFNVTDGHNDSNALTDIFDCDIFSLSNNSAPSSTLINTFDFDRNSWANTYKKLNIGFDKTPSRLDRILSTGHFNYPVCVESAVCFTELNPNSKQHVSDHFGINTKLTFFLSIYIIDWFNITICKFT